MTEADRKKLLRLLLPLIAVLIGTLLTAFAFLSAGFAANACNCSRPIAIAFPYATILWAISRLQWLGGALLGFQFPVYSLVVAIAKTREKRLRYALILLAIHAVAVIIGLSIHKG